VRGPVRKRRRNLFTSCRGRRRSSPDAPDLEPYGVDREAQSIVHARGLQARLADNFVHADLFDTPARSEERHYALALLMIGRLLKVPMPKAQQLLTVLRSRCDAVILYVYPGYSEHPLADLARDLGLRVDEQAPGVAGICC
jgi:hypothetical protein